MNDVGIKSCTEVVHLLHALSFDEIFRIMDDEVSRTIILYARPKYMTELLNKITLCSVSFF